jgi:hypothetical protein
MKLVDKLLCLFGLLLLFSFRALAHDPSMAHHEWFNKQEMTPERGRTRGTASRNRGFCVYCTK